MGYIGDSRAIMGSKDSNDSMVAIQLTVDLKPDLPSTSRTNLFLVGILENGCNVLNVIFEFSRGS